MIKKIINSRGICKHCNTQSINYSISKGSYTYFCLKCNVGLTNDEVLINSNRITKGFIKSLFPSHCIISKISNVGKSRDVYFSKGYINVIPIEPIRKYLKGVLISDEHIIFSLEF